MMDSEKSQLRTWLQQQRAAIPTALRRQRSAGLIQQLLQLPQWSAAKVVMGYCSMGGEIETWDLLRTVLQQDRHLVLPRVNSAQRVLELYRVRDLEQELAPGVWGIREPVPARCEAVDPTQLDLICVPGVGFDAAGGRLGYGAGYYDRLLATPGLNAVTVALAFAEQLVDSIPMGEHDRPIQWILSDEPQSDSC